MISVQETLEDLYIEPQRLAKVREKREEKAREKREKQTMNMLNDPRPDWDSWFMTLAFIVSQRSLDKHTKHGCVVVDEESHSILSVGYNSPPRGCIDSEMPLERPGKYLVMEHSESNAITNAARCGIPLKGSIFYVTGPPCHDCFRKIINVGAVNIVHGPILHKRTSDQSDAIVLMNKRKSSNSSSTILENVKIEQISNIDSVYALLSQTHEYIECKLKEQEENETKKDADGN